MRDKDFFKENLGEYESPLSNRVSFDKVIANTQKKAVPLWLNPKLVISAGLFLVMGTAVLGYYANSESVKTQNNANGEESISKIVDSDNSSNKVSKSKSNTAEYQSKDELITESDAIAKNTSKLTTEVDDEMIFDKSEMPKESSKNRVKGMERSNGLDLTKVENIKIQSDKSDVSKIEILSTEKVVVAEVEYTKDEILIGSSNTTDPNKTIATPIEKAVIKDKKIVSQVSIPNEAINAESKDQLIALDKEAAPNDKDLAKDDNPTKRGLNLEVSVLSADAKVYGQINEDASIAGTQRSFGFSSLLVKEINSRIQLGAGLGYSLNQSYGSYNWKDRSREQVIDSRDVVIVQPGLPDKTVTVYDTSYNNVVQNNSSDLAYSSEIVSLPIGIRYKIKDLGAFQILGTYTSQPGLIVVNSGHVFNNSEVIQTDRSANNTLVFQNRLSARLTYELGEKWSFLVEPVYSHTYYLEKALNTNKASKFGMGVGLMFKL